MNRIVEEDFEKQLEARWGLQMDPAYPHAKVLCYLDAKADERFWCYPKEAERRPYFFANLFELFGQWSSCYVWKRYGSWYSSADEGGINDAVQLEILKGLGLADGSTDVIEFSRSELPALTT